MQADISRADKIGHFDLLATGKSTPFLFSQIVSQLTRC
jgi:hypothetical protein